MFIRGSLPSTAKVMISDCFGINNAGAIGSADDMLLSMCTLLVLLG